MSKTTLKKGEGFTLIELLVVIAIIGLLASIITVSLNNSREKAKIAKAEGDLHQLRTAIEFLLNDTGKYPNGCPVHRAANPEVDLDNPRSGLVSQPPVGVVQSPCEWTAGEVAKWDGPYTDANKLEDGWGRSYRFDPDYWPYRNCGSIPQGNVTVAILSNGADGATYTCDDIYLDIIQR